MSEFCMILARKIIKIPEFLWYLPEKFARILHNNCPKNFFFPNFRGTCPSPLPPFSTPIRQTHDQSQFIDFAAKSAIIFCAVVINVNNLVEHWLNSSESSVAIAFVIRPQRKRCCCSGRGRQTSAVVVKDGWHTDGCAAVPSDLPWPKINAVYTWDLLWICSRTRRRLIGHWSLVIMPVCNWPAAGAECQFLVVCAVPWCILRVNSVVIELATVQLKNRVLFVSHITFSTVAYFLK